MKNKYLIMSAILLTLFSLVSCESFLDEKSDKQLAIPNTLADLTALLHHNNMFLSFSSAGEVSCGDFYLTDEDFDALYYESDKRLYTWQPDYVLKGGELVGNNWGSCYRAIYVSNSVLHNIEEFGLTGQDVDVIKGQALIYRAARYLDGVQIWAPIYNASTADTDLGMVIRLDPDFNLPSVRASVQQTYERIINDLKDAIPLLPVTTISANLPTKAAAFGLLARAYLTMGEYELALENANAALEFNAELIDFNELNPNDAFPIPGTDRYAKKEVIFLTGMTIHDFDMSQAVKITPDLYGLYPSGDLRKLIYFNQNNDGSYSFKGSHFRAGLFVGISTSELQLIAAECYARSNDIDMAALTLNKLAEKRWDPAIFSPYAFNDSQTALETILLERRKELLFRGLRWTDIKRLNRDGADITLSRTVNGQTITLTPNDKIYAIAIPEDIITIAGIPQNPR